MSIRFCPALACCLFATCQSIASASVDITGLSGTFSSPVLDGVVLNPDGSSTAFDNAATAEYAFEAGGAIIRWGSATLTPAPGFASSALGFLPAAAPGVVSDGDQFLLGTILFLNGNSELEKLIFGADLTITATAGAGGPVDPLVLDLDIFTTLNFPGDPAWSADFVTASGLGLTSDVSFHAYENAPGILAVDLYGGVVGDPMLAAELFVIPPAQQGNGFLGNGPLPAPIPEPATAAIWSLLGLGGSASAWYAAGRRRNEWRLPD